MMRHAEGVDLGSIESQRHNSSVQADGKREGGRSSNGDAAERRHRTRFSDAQRSILIQYFQQNRYPRDYGKISDVVRLPRKVVQHWFTNRRKREKDGSMALRRPQEPVIDPSISVAALHSPDMQREVANDCVAEVVSRPEIRDEMSAEILDQLADVLVTEAMTLLVMMRDTFERVRPEAGDPQSEETCLGKLLRSTCPLHQFGTLVHLRIAQRSHAILRSVLHDKFRRLIRGEIPVEQSFDILKDTLGGSLDHHGRGKHETPLHDK